MANKLKNKLVDIFWGFVINLTGAFQEIKYRVVDQKSSGSVRKIIKEINSNPRGPFFWAVLQKEEALLDFSKDRFVEVVIQKGQYRLERKIVKWGSSNPEMSWLVLENTTIGARETWWQSRAASNEIPLKLDADL